MPSGKTSEITLKVPGAKTFEKMLQKLDDTDYSCPLEVTEHDEFRVRRAVSSRFQIAAKGGFGRSKKRCLLACLGEAARKLTVLWLSLGLEKLLGDPMWLANHCLN